MAKCTAPILGHRSAAAEAACPVCGNRGFRGSRSYNYYSNTYTSQYAPSGSGSRLTSGTTRPSWSPVGSAVSYTTQEVRALSPIRKSVEERKTLAVKCDIFLCHAWDDRKDIATTLFDCLKSLDVAVWFSEKAVPLGAPLLREIDKGLANSRIGIVLVTPAFLNRIKGEGIADKELSALLARDLLVPIVHNTTYEDLRNVSPLLASRSGFDTAEDSFEVIATKLAELVSLEDWQ